MAVLDQQNTTVNIDQNINATANDIRIGQSFTCGIAGTLDSVVFKMHKTGSPVGNVTCELYADNGIALNGNSPTGSALSSSTTNLDAATVSTDANGVEYTFSFPNDFTLVVGTIYWAVLSATYATNASNHIKVRQNNSGDAYAAGHSDRYNGSSWMADQGANDLYFKQYVTPTNQAWFAIL